MNDFENYRESEDDDFSDLFEDVGELLTRRQHFSCWKTSNAFFTIQSRESRRNVSKRRFNASNQVVEPQLGNTVDSCVNVQRHSVRSPSRLTFVLISYVFTL